MNNHVNGRSPRLDRGTRARTVLEALATAVLVSVVASCSLDGLMGTEQLPEDVIDPAVIETPRGALRAYHGALSQFGQMFGASGNTVVTLSGLLTDELEWLETNHAAGVFVDRRALFVGGAGDEKADGLFNGINRARGQVSQAMGLHRDFAPDSLSALGSHLYALQGYAEIFLADLFCSGIPLSTLDYGGDYTYRPGSTTVQVYEHALALLDTALAEAGDSARFRDLARMGRARALLNLGRFAEAGAAAAEVPTDFRYAVAFDDPRPSFARARPEALVTPWQYSVSDLEGMNGLDFRSSGDPRTQASLLTSAGGHTAYHPGKYSATGVGAVVLASGIEARLIEAEAALNANDPGWLDYLNDLRETMWVTIEPATAGPLPALADPGTDAARTDLLFRERAFWLFLTGQRQGDLRRLIRHYGRTQDQVYPTGTYTGVGGAGLRFDTYVDFPVPQQERVSNPHYDGCISRS